MVINIFYSMSSILFFYSIKDSSMLFDSVKIFSSYLFYLFTYLFYSIFHFKKNIHRCPVIIPRKECILARDPKDSCCYIQYCDFISENPFSNGIPASVDMVSLNPKTTPSPYVLSGRIPLPTTVKPSIQLRPPLGKTI